MFLSQCFFCILLLFISLLSFASDASESASESIIFVGEKKNLTATKLVQRVKNSLTEKNIYHTHTTEAALQQDIIITFGLGPLQKLLDKPVNNHIIACFLTSNQYSSLKSKHKLKNLTALFVDANPAYQYLLAKQVLGSKTDISFIYKKISSFALKEIIKVELAGNLKAPRFEVKNINEVLNYFSNEQVGGILVDEKMHTSSTVPILLRRAYFQRVPVIGFNSKIVNAGGLASIYLSVENISNELVNLIRNILVGRQTPPMFSTEFEISLNRSLADSLDIPIESEQEIKKGILRVLNEYE